MRATTSTVVGSIGILLDNKKKYRLAKWSTMCRPENLGGWVSLTLQL